MRFAARRTALPLRIPSRPQNQPGLYLRGLRTAVTLSTGAGWRIFRGPLHIRRLRAAPSPAGEGLGFSVWGADHPTGAGWKIFRGPLHIRPLRRAPSPAGEGLGFSVWGCTGNGRAHLRRRGKKIRGNGVGPFPRGKMFGVSFPGAAVCGTAGCRAGSTGPSDAGAPGGCPAP